MASRDDNQEQALLRMLFDAMPQLGWTAQPDGFIDYYNRGWYEYTGTTFKEMEGWGWQSVHDPAILPKVMETWKTSIARGLPWEQEFPLRRHDGVFRWFLSRATPVRDQNGKLLRWVGINTDIDEQKHALEKLAQLDRAKTEFFANVSHEFRTPLTLLLGPTEDAVLTGSPLAGDNLETVYRNGLRLLKLVNSLLDFSRMEAGRAQASFQATDIALVTADLASSFRSAIERAGLRFEVDCPKATAPAYVDRDMWEKVVLNLLSNALKFTLEGSIRVSLRQEADRFELQVRDTGIGISAADLPRIFERFHRVEGARSRTHEGSGIGLALVHELVRMHGGAVSVASELGKGSTFTVRIPAGSAHLPAERIDATPTLARTTLGAAPFVQEALRWLPDGHAGVAEEPRSATANSAVAATVAVPDDIVHSRIVLADDNADMRDYLRRLLSQRWEVEAVGDGQAALDAARRQPPDLVLTDVMMPRLDGFGLLSALRGDPVLKHVPVILLSARAGEEARAGGLEAGANDYLVKPFSARELLARVTTQLQLLRLRREVERALSAEREARRASEALIAEVKQQGKDVEMTLRQCNEARERAESRVAELEGAPRKKG